MKVNLLKFSRKEKEEVALAARFRGGPGTATSDWVVMSRAELDWPGPCSLWATTRTLYMVPGSRPCKETSSKVPRVEFTTLSLSESSCW